MIFFLDKFHCLSMSKKKLIALILTGWFRSSAFILFSNIKKTQMNVLECSMKQRLDKLIFFVLEHVHYDDWICFTIAFIHSFIHLMRIQRGNCDTCTTFEWLRGKGAYAQCTYKVYGTNPPLLPTNWFTHIIFAYIIYCSTYLMHWLRNSNPRITQLCILLSINF